MVKTTVIRRSSQGALSKEMIRAAFTKNKRLPTPYEDRLYQAMTPLLTVNHPCNPLNVSARGQLKHVHTGIAFTSEAECQYI